MKLSFPCHACARARCWRVALLNFKIRASFSIYAGRARGDGSESACLYARCASSIRLAEVVLSYGCIVHIQAYAACVCVCVCLGFNPDAFLRKLWMIFLCARARGTRVLFAMIAGIIIIFPCNDSYNGGTTVNRCGMFHRV